MKIAIIGCGNMGSAIAYGLTRGTVFKPSDITAIDVRREPLDALKALSPEINTALEIYDNLPQADIILLAVKPWLVKDTIWDIKFKLDYSRQIIISIAAGVTINEINESLKKVSDPFELPTLFRVIPNTAIAVGESMSLISSNNATPEQQNLLMKIFNEMGKAVIIDESKLANALALTSCGIAYFFRHVRAAMQAGVEMGFYPKEAQDLIVHTMKGAAELLLQTGANPEE
ncbi:MAG: NAD(P)-binding domain-containing protein, partial [Candidatus Azobacteroides sp.]|nr:NAD(P)-binding domain-containing protein [Candidatus Azobacteroides sp.]